MGRNSAQVFGAVSRDDVLRFQPETLVLVTDEAHPLYDPRVSMPIDEAMVLSIMALGVIQPIVVRRSVGKDDETIVEVVEGRQRVKNAIEANKRLKKAGREPVLVPAVRRKNGDDLDSMGVSAASFIRTPEPIIDQAKKIAKYLNMGGNEAMAASIFGVSRTTIHGRVLLVEAHKAVQKAVASGEISVEVGIKLAKLPNKEQSLALEDVQKEKSPGKKRAKAGEKVPATKTRMLGLKKIRQLRDVISCSPEPPDAYQTLLFVLGELEKVQAVAFSEKWLGE